MNEFFAQLKQIWARFTGLQKGAVVGVGVLVIVGGVVTMVAAQSTEWRTLGAGLSRKEVQSVLTKLEDNAVPYRLRESGSAVEVPSDRWDEVQAIVVKDNLLDQKAGKGYDHIIGGGLMDTKSQREFKQLIAKQEELEMAIARLEGIAEATVYITPAKNHWTKSGSERAKASVMIRSEGAHLVTAQQVETVVRFVANAVKELEPDSVVVTDTRGVVLARPEGSDMLNATASLAQTHGLRLQGQAQDALERVFGRDKIVVRCHVEFDNEMVRTETDGIVPDSKVVVSETIRSTENLKPSPGGAASTVNTQVGKAGTNAPVVNAKTEDTETKYEIGRQKIVRVKDGGAVKHLAVSVIADESLTEHAAAVESLVKSAVGYQASRGDTWGGVSFAPFVIPEPVAGPVDPGLWTPGFIWDVVTWSITGVVGLAMAFMLWGSARRAQREVQSALAGIAKEKEDSRTEIRADPKDELRELVDQDFDTVSKLLRNWLYEPVGSR